MRSTKKNSVLGSPSFLRLSLCLLLCGVPALAQSQQTPVAQETQAAAPQTIEPTPGAPQSNPQSSGSIAGTIVDQTGAFVPGVRVVLTRGDQSTKQETSSDGFGRYYFLDVAPGAFQLSISAPQFTTEVVSGTVQLGEHYLVPEIKLALAGNVTQVTVAASQEEIAEEQIKVQETQRVFGLIPNYFVSYVPDAAPLTPKQKFELAWKSTTDPVTIVTVAAVAGFEQAGNQFSGYGQGAQGYGKRFGASYADVFDGTFLGSALLPSLLKQDPRYFYRGTGSTRSRLLYALSNSVMCKGDNKRWQPNYSNIIGNLAAGGIANLYYPQADRGAALVFETGLIRVGESAFAGVFQEFVLRKLTPKASGRNSTEN
jgi:carboxypeptidase family protein